MNYHITLLYVDRAAYRKYGYGGKLSFQKCRGANKSLGGAKGLPSNEALVEICGFAGICNQVFKQKALRLEYMAWASPHGSTREKWLDQFSE